MIELAGGGGYRFAAASMTGPCLNPWDRTRWAGGSSSGSGGGVAAGLVPYALGSETSGSILTPAALLRRDRIYAPPTGWSPGGRDGAVLDLDKIGPLARSAEDCGLVLEAISGGGDAGRSFHFAPQYSRPLAELRAGYVRAHFEELAAPNCVRRSVPLSMSSAQMGVALVETKVPEFPYSAMTGTIIGAEAASIFEDLIESGRVEELDDAAQTAGLRAALDIPARDYLRAMRLRTCSRRSFGNGSRGSTCC